MWDLTVGENIEELILIALASEDGEYQDYSYVWNGMWLVVVTMTSGN